MTASWRPDIQVVGPLEFIVAGTRFQVVMADYDAHRTDADKIIVLKGLDWFQLYDRMIRAHDVRRMLELGIWEGGSAILFALLFPELKIVSIDIRKPDPAVQAHVDRLALTDRVRLHYTTSQDDRDRLSAILAAEFGDAPIDLVSDDASHQYYLARASFEILFPRLRQGGIYVVEDWAWAHWDGAFQTTQWADMPALTNLAFELTMLAGARPDLVDRLEIRPGTLAVHKSAGVMAEFALGTAYRNRGRTLGLI